VDKQTYIIGPAVSVGKKKERKHAADALAKQLMRLLAEGYDIIEISGYSLSDDERDSEDEHSEVHGIPAQDVAAAANGDSREFERDQYRAADVIRS
jgi:hypothetical protein